MKKIAILLTALLLTVLTGCVSAEAPAETTLPAQTAGVAEAETEPVTETTEPTEAVTGELFLKASSVTLSVVGETDDIYLGTVPREHVRFESDDEAVVTFTDGVLTAAGVGSTTVRAVWEDQSLECAVSCLANTREELLTLDKAILTAPKRLPPEVDLTEECTYFGESAIMGDSITYIMFQWESKYDYLGDMTFFTRGGISLNGLVKYYKNIYFQGKEMHFEDIVAKSGIKKLYIMIGQNDLSSNAGPIVFDNWRLLLDRIWEQSPDVEIVIQSCIPEYDAEIWRDDKNAMIAEHNVELRQFAAENNCKFIDLCYYVQDHYGRMAKPYSQDHYHMNEDGCINWMKILRFYAQLENKGGTLA